MTPSSPIALNATHILITYFWPWPLSYIPYLSINSVPILSTSISNRHHNLKMLKSNLTSTLVFHCSRVLWSFCFYPCRNCKPPPIFMLWLELSSSHFLTKRIAIVLFVCFVFAYLLLFQCNQHESISFVVFAAMSPVPRTSTGR